MTDLELIFAVLLGIALLGVLLAVLGIVFDRALDVEDGESFHPWNRDTKTPDQTLRDAGLM